MIQYKEIKLDNGLTVLLSPQKDTSLVAVNILYSVGSSAEPKELTGQAHFLEHMMFTGTSEVPDYDTIVQQCGGENNAYTTKDYTNLYSYGPASNLEVLLFLEADRMANLQFEDKKFTTQKNVIVEEYNESVLSTPLGKFWDYLGTLMYSNTSYEWSTIGKDKEDIEKISKNDLVQFYSKINPANGYLSVVGNFELDKAIELVEKYFGSTKKSSVLEPKPEVKVQDYGTKMEEKDTLLENPCFYLLYPIPPRSSDSYYTFDLICDILSLGKKSRFYTNYLTQDSEFSSLIAWVSDTIYANLFIIEGKIYPDADIESSIAKIKSELTFIMNEGVTEEELLRVKNKTMTNLALSDHSVLNRAINLSYYAFLGQTELINNELSIYEKISQSDIQSMAKLHLNRKNVSELIIKN